jgi:hypothetical protein
VRFYNTGPNQLPGLIVMSVEDADGSVDRAHDRLVVVFNANDQAQTYAVPALVGKRLTLHPLQIFSLDAVERTSSFNRTTGTFSVPGRTAAVFWSNRSGHGN